jgi:hypothetical protein
MTNTARELDMAATILSYLEEHPQASDTLEGIAGWWIMRQRVWVEVESLKKVLHGLAERGLLDECGDKDNPRYRLKSTGELHEP